MTEMHIVKEPELIVVEKDEIKITEKLRPHSMKEYLKMQSVKQKTTQDLKNVNLNHLNSLEHHIPDEEVHVRSYCKLVKHILKLEYHHFDHNWFHNLNRTESSNMINLQDLSFVPGRVERFMRMENPKRLHHTHTRIHLEH